MKIFSPHMIAAGNIQEEKELNEICHLVETNLSFYLDRIIEFHEDSKPEDVIRGAKLLL